MNICGKQKKGKKLKNASEYKVPTHFQWLEQ